MNNDSRFVELVKRIERVIDRNLIPDEHVAFYHALLFGPTGEQDQIAADFAADLAANDAARMALRKSARETAEASAAIDNPHPGKS